MSRNDNPQAYPQWVAIEIVNRSSRDTLIIKDISLAWGKLYDGTSKGNEVQPKDIDGTEIKHGKSYTVYSCGREGASSGTEGSLNLVDGGSNEAVVKIAWDCPWWGKNRFDIVNNSDDWLAGSRTRVPPDGAIGTVTVTVVHL